MDIFSILMIILLVIGCLIWILIGCHVYEKHCAEDVYIYLGDDIIVKTTLIVLWPILLID